ncbi:MAG: DUF309 domain-containing protein [Thermoplasmata archaeon]
MLRDTQNTTVAKNDFGILLTRILIDVMRTKNFDRSRVSIPGAKKTVFRFKQDMIEIDVVTDSISKVLEYISSNFMVVDIRNVRERTSEANPSISEILNHLLECEILSLSERFWECHTALESVWMHSSAEYKIFLQSIILFSSSQAKYQMLNIDAARGMYLRAHMMLLKSGKSTMVLTDLKDDFYYPINWRFNISSEIRTRFYLRYFNLE